MGLHVFVFLLVFFLILGLALLWRLDWFHLQPSSSRGGTMHSRAHRLLKPSYPDDCLASTASSGGEPADVASLARGEKPAGSTQARDTAGFACPNPKCPYLGITDDQIPALVGDGKHGRAERIQTFRGPACRTTFSARRHTPCTV
jgi:hypothetical protein